MAITIGEVKAVLGADIKGLQKGLSQAQSELKSFASSAAGSIGALGNIGAAAGPAGLAVAAGMGMAVTAVTALGSVIAKTTKDFAAFGSSLTDLSDKTGVSTDALQKLGYAGSFVGVSMQEIGSAAGIMQRNLTNGDTVFQRLGLSLEKLKQLSPEEQFQKIGEEINKLPSAAQKTAAAMEVFGKAGASLLPLFKSNMAEAAKEAERLGIVLGQDNVAAADRIDDALTKLNAVWNGLLNNFAAAVSGGGDFASLIDSVAESVGTFSKGVQDAGPQIAAFVSELKGMVSSLESLVPLWMKLAAFKLKDTFTLTESEQNAMRMAQGVAEVMSGKRQMGVNYKAETIVPETFKAKAGFISAEQMKQAAEANKRYIDQIKKSFEELQKETDIVDEAFQQLQRTSVEGLNKVTDALAGTRAAGLIGAAAMPGLGPEAAGGGIPGVSQADVEKAIANGARLGELARQRDLQLEQTRIKMEENKDAAIDWSEELQNVRNAFEVLGISADSVLGRVLGGIAAGAQAIKGMDFKGKMGGFSLTGGGGFGGLLKNLSGGMQLGAAALGVGKAIVGLFTSSPVEKAAKAAAKILGTKISKELAETIAKTAKDKGVSFALASLLNIGAVMKESGKDPRSFMGQIGDLMNATKLGAVPAADGITAIGEAFNQVAEAALKAGSIGDKALVQMIQRSRELGLKVPEITQFVSEQLAKAAQGVEAMVAGITPTTQAGADAQGAIFAGAFWATFKEKGLVAASDAFGAAMDQFKAQLEKGGLELPPAFQEIIDLINVGKNEQVRGAASGAAGAGAALEGIANAGFMDKSVLEAMGPVLADAMNQAMAGGATQKQALEIIAPELSKLLTASANSGIALTEQEKQLIQMAKDNGIEILEEPMAAQTRILGEIRDILKGGGGAAVGGSSSPGVPVGTANGPMVPAFDSGSGGLKNFGSGTLAMLHGREGVFTEEQLNGLGNMTISPVYNLSVMGSGLDKDSLAAVLMDIVKNNNQGLVDQITRAQAGRR